MHWNRMRDVVLVGGGHAHVQVLQAFARRPPEHGRLQLIVDRPVTVYSGMVPGFVAGQYRADELEIDTAALAGRAGAHLVVGRAVRIDIANRQVLLQAGPPVPYDLASFDIGSTVAGLDLPGVRDYAIPTRPIHRLVSQVEATVARARLHQGGTPFRALVVGGGSGGVELAFALAHRVRRESAGPVEVLLLESGPRILPGFADSLVRRVHHCATARGIEIRCHQTVVAAEAEAVRLEGGETISYQALVWAAGAASQPIFRESGLSTDDRGFVRIRSTLQLEHHEALFAAGDCATLIDHPETPKAGVYAVRQGPLLVENLRAALATGKLRGYRPQRDFLTLLNLGDGPALGAKWGVAIEGRWVMKLKDWIDRRFVRRFSST